MADPDAPRKAPNKGDPRVNNLLPLYGNSNFADILNRLWMNGAKIDDLEKALAPDGITGNTPYDVIKRLLDKGLATEEQLRMGMQSYLPPNAAESPWPFRPELKDKTGRNIAAFREDAVKFYPDAPRPNLPAAPNSVVNRPAGGPGGPGAISTVTGPGSPKPEKKPRTDAEVLQYEKDHYSNMLWVKNDPELNDLLKQAATNTWTPEKFRAEFENSKWYKTRLPEMRAFDERVGRGDISLDRDIKAKTEGLLAMSQAMGFAFSYQDLEPLAKDAMRLGWTDLDLKKNIISKVQFDPNQAGGFGAFSTQTKSVGKDYLVRVSDQEAFDWSKKLFTGEATQESVQEAMKAKAKASYPGIADLIDKGLVPKQYFSNHVSTAAQLLEVSEDEIDLTDPKYNQIVTHVDEQGKFRPMSVYETTKFIKGKDEYWKTSNSANEVANTVNQLGSMFGKVAM